MPARARHAAVGPAVAAAAAGAALHVWPDAHAPQARHRCARRAQCRCTPLQGTKPPCTSRRRRASASCTARSRTSRPWGSCLQPPAVVDVRGDVDAHVRAAMGSQTGRRRRRRRATIGGGVTHGPSPQSWPTGQVRPQAQLLMLPWRSTQTESRRRAAGQAMPPSIAAAHEPAMRFWPDAQGAPARPAVGRVDLGVDAEVAAARGRRRT